MARIWRCVPSHRLPVDQQSPVLVTDENVLRNTQVGEDRRFLVDGGDTELLCLGCIPRSERLTGQGHGAFVGRVDPGHQLDQGGLARPVLADQGVDLAGTEREVHVGERLRRAEPLGHSLDDEEGRFLGHAVHGSVINPTPVPTRPPPPRSEV